MKREGVSILISTFNGSARLEKTLKALAGLDTSQIPFVELILIDNASTDDTLKVAAHYWESFGAPFSLTCLSELKAGKLYAQELGLQYVKGKYVLICDDDNSLFQDYLTIGYACLEQNGKVGVLGGQGIAKSEVPFPKWFEQHAYFYGCGSQANKTGNVKPIRNVVYGAGMWFRYAAYEKAKDLGYQFILGSREGAKLTTGGEDSELCWMLIFQGYEVWYLEGLKFYHHILANRLTDNYRVRLLEGMGSGGLNASIHLRVWYGSIVKKVKRFWMKEAVYTFLYMLKIPFDQNINLKNKEFKRCITNLKLLLVERSAYDKKINKILDFKLLCSSE